MRAGRMIVAVRGNRLTLVGATTLPARRSCEPSVTEHALPSPRGPLEMKCERLHTSSGKSGPRLGAYPRKAPAHDSNSGPPGLEKLPR